eukprot:scaffold14326_cov37-Phaeocystis_antarctica.AAC.1
MTTTEKRSTMRGTALVTASEKRSHQMLLQAPSGLPRKVQRRRRLAWPACRPRRPCRPWAGRPSRRA